MDRLSWIHSHYWPAAHQFVEALVWHRWLLNELEKQMRKIKPDIALPYWVQKNHSFRSHYFYLALKKFLNGSKNFFLILKISFFYLI
jgi:hypothetical protein